MLWVHRVSNELLSIPAFHWFIRPHEAGAIKIFAIQMDKQGRGKTGRHSLKIPMGELGCKLFTFSWHGRISNAESWVASQVSQVQPARCLSVNWVKETHLLLPRAEASLLLQCVCLGLCLRLDRRSPRPVEKYRAGALIWTQHLPVWCPLQILKDISQRWFLTLGSRKRTKKSHSHRLTESIKHSSFKAMGCIRVWAKDSTACRNTVYTCFTFS